MLFFHARTLDSLSISAHLTLVISGRQLREHLHHYWRRCVNLEFYSELWKQKTCQMRPENAENVFLQSNSVFKLS